MTSIDHDTGASSGEAKDRLVVATPESRPEHRAERDAKASRAWSNLRRWRRGSLVVDSTIKILLVGIGLAALFALISMLLIRNHESRRLMNHVEELLSTVESAARVACFTGDTTLASDVARGLLTNRLIAGVKITAGGQILAGASRYSGDQAGGNVVIRPIMSPFNAQQTVGQIELTTDGNYIQYQAAEYSLMSSMALMLEVIAVACAVALVIMRRVVQPIRIFSDRTHSIQIDTGEHVIAPEGNADNEIGQLANDFNRMIGNMNTLLATEQSMREEIALNERRFRTLVENTPDIIVRYDRDCRLVFANRAYCRETGHRVEQVLGKGVGDGGTWRPELSVEDYCRRLRRVMSSGIPDLIVLEWQRLDGQRVSHEMYVVAEYDADGQISGTLAIGRDVTERKAVERQLQHQASYDALTGLPNRRMFHERLRDEIAQADRMTRGLAVLFIDLDRFKEVNDTLGHSIGDQLLVLAAQRIQHCVRETDTVARLAGDEFVVIITDIDHLEPLERMAQDIVTGMSRPFHFGEHSAFVSASIGIAKYPGDADNAETLLGCADQAMYFAKESGRNSYRLFTVGMLEQAQYRLQLAADLREALNLGQLELHYQPIFAIGNPLAVKAEALLRWRHPRLGQVPPNQFIAIAEETGLIEEIGNWVFCQAVDTAKYWNAVSDDSGLRQVSINVSPRQFLRGNLDSCIDYIRDSGVNPAAIVIEITEGLLLDDQPEIHNKLQRLHQTGVQLALDDFGTGYSAMGYLKKFNIDYLKIDKTFIRDLETDPGDRAIAEAIVAMSHRLGLRVIAEGVENLGQLELLEAVGCEYIQGYLFAKPMPRGQFLDYAGCLQIKALSSAARYVGVGELTAVSEPRFLQP